MQTMCDTVVALGSVTADGAVIFGKNSDREPNEAHHLLRVPAATHAAGSRVQCTYIDIPQAKQTYEVLLAKPFWIWGAEMGANENGVAIGNEAVFAKVPYQKEDSLIGMDLLRLGLERGGSARAALDVIVGLLAEYGQGGNCGLTHEMYYHNSFIIADAGEAWVLETAGPHWVAERITDGVRTISNGLTIGSEWDLASDDLVSHAVERGWCKGRDDFHFARCYSDFIYTTFSRSAARHACTTDFLRHSAGKVTVQTVIDALRSHGPDASGDPAGYSPASGLANRQICQHAGFGPIRGDQTTGSMVSHLTPEEATHFLTGTAAPCTSVFKPVWTGVDLPDIGPEPTSTYDGATLWWRHESLHRATLLDFPARLSLYAGQRDDLEREFIAGALACCTAPLDERATFMQDCFAQADTAESDWRKRVLAADGPTRRGPLYAAAWAGYNHAAQMPD